MAEGQGRSSGQGVKLLYIRDYLHKHSSKEHPKSSAEIIDYLSTKGITANRKTIYNDILRLKADFQEPIEYNEQKWGYYITKPPFTAAELAVLIDCIRYAPYITQEDAQCLTDKIKGLANEYDLQILAQYAGANGRKKYGESSILDNIQIITQAIKRKRMIKFQMIERVAEHTTHTRVNPNVILASPFDLKWEDGEYVLSYAIDLKLDPDDDLPDDDNQVDCTRKVSLLTNIQITDLPSTYRDKSEDDKNRELGLTFVGYGTKVVTIRFRNSALKKVQEDLGKHAVLIPLDDHHFTISIRRMINYEFCDWIGSFGCEAKIISPPEVAKFFLAVLEDDLDEIKRLYKYDLEPVHLLSGEEYWALPPEHDRLIRPDLNNRVCVVNDEHTMYYVLHDIPNPNV